MTEDLDAFLAGERPDDVAIYVADEVVDDPEKLVRFGHRTDDGLVLVLDGETGRSVFQTATGVAPMGFAKEAGEGTGKIHDDLTGGECPELEDGGESPGDHRARFLLSFVQPRTEGESVAARYAEGDVVHAYVQCACGTAYSDWWVAGEDADEAETN